MVFGFHSLVAGLSADWAMNEYWALTFVLLYQLPPPHEVQAGIWPIIMMASTVKADNRLWAQKLGL